MLAETSNVVKYPHGAQHHHRALQDNRETRPRGMGEVYRATDTKLGREVAIKVLPEALAGNAERLARFQREAELLTSLNHPDIAAIHGLEESGGSKALVL